MLKTVMILMIMMRAITLMMITLMIIVLITAITNTNNRYDNKMIEIILIIRKTIMKSGCYSVTIMLREIIMIIINIKEKNNDNKINCKQRQG